MGLTHTLNLKEGTPAVSSGCLLFPEMGREKQGIEQELATAELATAICFKKLGGCQLHWSNPATVSSQLKALLKLLQYHIYSKSFKVNSALS